MKPDSALRCELAAEVTARFGRVCARASGTSMVPAVHPGDLVFIDRLTPLELKVGDIVAFRRHDRWVIHRLASLIPDPRDPQAEAHWCVTRGDRIRHGDPPVRDSEIIGRVTYIERAGARFLVSRRQGEVQQLTGMLLSFSDLATSLYLRLFGLRRYCSNRSWPLSLRLESGD